MLVCAMNPCKCGWYGHPSGRCRCSQKDVEKYVSKISGPLLDRIDMQIEVPAVSPWDLADIKSGEPSAAIRDRVLKARAVQAARFKALGAPQLSTNSQLKGELLEQAAALDDDASQLLINYSAQNRLSARAYHRILRLARTIADLQSSEKVLKLHIAEALSYRRPRLNKRN